MYIGICYQNLLIRSLWLYLLLHMLCVPQKWTNNSAKKFPKKIWNIKYTIIKYRFIFTYVIAILLTYSICHIFKPLFMNVTDDIACLIMKLILYDKNE